MRIVQTFWTAGQDPLKHSFGWSHPQYNLMSWALSCLSLREHYDDVELYTDSAGYHILIEVLGLPYTKTHVVFDDFKCLPHHWALAKIKTYSMQTEPFIHVDGDIYVPKPLPKEVEDAPLVAQNREIGTSYYRRMIDKGVLCYPSIQIPDFMVDGVKAESVSSYNTGFFGGSDIEFIQSYCDEVFRFIDSNKLNEQDCPHSMANCNVFMEQAFFATLADQKGKDVFCIYVDPVRDNGYCVEEFCYLNNYFSKPFFHLLGGHKRNEYILNMLSRSLLLFYPNMLQHILHMYKGENVIYRNGGVSTSQIFLNYFPLVCRDEIAKIISNWNLLNVDDVFRWERAVANDIIYNSVSSNKNKKISICPWLCTYSFPKTLEKSHILSLNARLNKSRNFPLKEIALIPCIYGLGIKEIALTEITKQLLHLLSCDDYSVEQLRNALIFKYKINKPEDKQTLEEILLSELEKLQNSGFICLTFKE